MGPGSSPGTGTIRSILCTKVLEKHKNFVFYYFLG